MADIVKKIIDIGGAVKEAVQTTRTNERESKAIERVADRVYGLVHTHSERETNGASSYG